MLVSSGWTDVTTYWWPYISMEPMLCSSQTVWPEGLLLKQPPRVHVWLLQYREGPVDLNAHFLPVLDMCEHNPIVGEACFGFRNDVVGIRIHWLDSLGALSN